MDPRMARLPFLNIHGWPGFAVGPEQGRTPGDNHQTSLAPRHSIAALGLQAVTAPAPALTLAE